MTWRIIQVIIIFLNIFPVVSLIARKPEISLLQYGIFFVPQRQRKTQKLFFITNATDSLFSPAVSFASGHIVTDKFPGSSVFTIVFPYGSPLTICYVRSPFF